MAISEQKMKIVIENYFKAECNVNTSIREAFEKGFRIGVKKALSAQPEQKWIPVSRDLPEPRWKDVLVTREYKGADDGNKDKRYVDVASMCGDEWVSYSDEYKMHPKNHKVIAWMELPNAYGGEPGC